MYGSNRQPHSSWANVARTTERSRGDQYGALQSTRENRSPYQQSPQCYDFRKSPSPFVEQAIRLVTNAYNITTRRTGSTIHEYRLSITTSTGCKDIPHKVLTKNFVCRSIRKLLMESIVPQLIPENAHLLLSNGSIILDTNLEALYSTVLFQPAKKQINSDREIYLFKHIFVKTDLLANLYVDIVIEFYRSFSLDSMEQSSAFLTSVLHHKLFLDMLRYGTVYYMSQQEMSQRQAIREERLDLISKHTIGISLSGIKRSVNEQNLVVIHCSHSYITQTYKLIDLLATFLANRPVENVRLNHSTTQPVTSLSRLQHILNVCSTDAWFSTFSSMLIGFKCRVSGPKETNIRYNLAEESASDLLIVDPETNDSLTVYDYYFKLGINLNYPNLPCLKSQSSKPSYYPFELCSLLPGQKVPIFRLSNAAGHHLAAMNKPNPGLSKESSSKARNEVVKISSKEFSTFGMEMSADPVETYGSILQTPILNYRDRSIEPDSDYWESSKFCQPIHLNNDWCVVLTTRVDQQRTTTFFSQFCQYCRRFGILAYDPFYLTRSKDDIIGDPLILESIIRECKRRTNDNLKLVVFIIDSSSTHLNRLIHLSFEEHHGVTATCLRSENITNLRKERSIFRTFTHKLNTRLGGTNVIYHSHTLERLSLRGEDLLIVGLDVTHPDNELSGVSIVGCAYTYNPDLFKHRSLVWPQNARVEIITRADSLFRHILNEYQSENRGELPRQIIVYRDGVSHEEFEKVRLNEVVKAQSVIDDVATETRRPKPTLSYIIAQKRHTMRFFLLRQNNVPSNPPTGTLVDQDIVKHAGREFFLYSNTSPQATARPLHYHVLVNGLGIENLQKLTYFLCFNFGKCSGTLSMPSSLRYAHNAAYEARNRVIASKEFSMNRFYSSKFYC